MRANLGTPVQRHIECLQIDISPILSNARRAARIYLLVYYRKSIYAQLASCERAFSIPTVTDW